MLIDNFRMECRLVLTIQVCFALTHAYGRYMPPAPVELPSPSMYYVSCVCSRLCTLSESYFILSTHNCRGLYLKSSSISIFPTLQDNGTSQRKSGQKSTFWDLAYGGDDSGSWEKEANDGVKLVPPNNILLHLQTICKWKSILATVIQLQCLPLVRVHGRLRWCTQVSILGLTIARSVGFPLLIPQVS